MSQRSQVLCADGLDMTAFEGVSSLMAEPTTEHIPKYSMIVDSVEELIAFGGYEKWNFLELAAAVPPLDELFIEWNTSPKFAKTGILQCGVSLFKQEATSVWRKAAVEQGFEEPKWMIAALMFVSIRGNPYVMPKVFGIALDKTGKVSPVSDLFIISDIDIETQKQPSLSDVFGVAEMVSVHVWQVVFLALSFANCKNVAKRDVTETEGPPAKWIRRQKAPTIRYHVLDINPMREVLRKEGGLETNGLKKALHLCRGHFATYTAEKPLFGHVTGTFWKPQHVRGSLEQGAVVKDYRIKLPQSPTTPDE